MKCLSQSHGRARAEKAEVETSAALKSLKKSAPSSCMPSSISPHLHSDPTPTGPHNKENLQQTPCSAHVLAMDEVLPSCSSVAEDSGYLSLHNSHLEQHDGETLESCTEHKSAEPRSRCLPVLQFQEEVCKQLAKGYRKSKIYDWTVVNKLAENFGLHNVIGKKMGLEYVDLLCELLKKDMKHILTRILGLLGENDLINCKKVSKTWQKIIHGDTRAVRRCRKAEQALRDSRKSTESLSRDFGLSRVVFSCLQSVASNAPGHKFTKTTQRTHAHRQAHGTQNPVKPSRFAEFQEAAKSLKSHESLRSCRLCDSPARVDSAMKRAVCLRANCAFDFCSLCQLAYHGSKPCQGGVIKASPGHYTPQSVSIAGSTRSKRNVRRL